jgi:hypothetical protein
MKKLLVLIGILILAFGCSSEPEIIYRDVVITATPLALPTSKLTTNQEPVTTPAPTVTATIQATIETPVTTPAPTVTATIQATIETIVGKQSEEREKQISIPTVTAKEKLISMRFNVPIVGSVDEARQEYVASLDIPEKYRQRFIEVQENLNSVLGGYPNYIYFAYNKNGTEEDAKPVLERMAQIRPYKEWSISELIESQSCLGNANPGGARTSTTNPYSVCLENLAFIEHPWGEEMEHPYGISSDNSSYIKMALHLAHEYFHHYQRAHALDRGLNDRDNPEATVQAPRWWLEGAAVTFQNAWYKDNWQSFSELKSLTLEQALSISIANVTNSWAYKQNRSNIMGYGDSEVCPPDWYMSSLEDRYDTASGCNAATMATAYLGYLTSYKIVWIDIPQDYYDLGFWGSVKKHTGMTKQEFYDSYNEFLRTGDPDDEPPDGWVPPENYISEYADFLKIISDSN